MAKLKKLILTETKSDVSSTIGTELTDKDPLEKQLEKFSTSYSSTKLDNLYKEYEQIDLSKEELKANEIKPAHKVSFKKGLFIGTTFVITVLFMFLCIYNIVVIKKYSSGIDMLQRDVAITSSDLTDLEADLASRMEEVNITEGLEDAGYQQSTSSKKIPRLSKTNKSDQQGPTNWFDKFCNFISNLFGKN